GHRAGGPRRRPAHDGGRRPIPPVHAHRPAVALATPARDARLPPARETSQPGEPETVGAFVPKSRPVVPPAVRCALATPVPRCRAEPAWTIRKLHSGQQSPPT